MGRSIDQPEQQGLYSTRRSFARICGLITLSGSLTIDSTPPIDDRALAQAGIKIIVIRTYPRSSS